MTDTILIRLADKRLTDDERQAVLELRASSTPAIPALPTPTHRLYASCPRLIIGWIAGICEMAAKKCHGNHVRGEESSVVYERNGPIREPLE